MAHAEARAVAERRRDLRAAPGEVDDDVAEAAPRQRLQVMLDQRPAADLSNGLGVGQRPHALAAPGGEDHRLHAATRRQLARIAGSTRSRTSVAERGELRVPSAGTARRS